MFVIKNKEKSIYINFKYIVNCTVDNKYIVLYSLSRDNIWINRKKFDCAHLLKKLDELSEEI